MNDQPFIKVNLPNESSLTRQDFRLNEAQVLKEKGRQRRKNLHENTKHLLAIAIITPYILLLILGAFFNFSVPQAYETISLIIIGYYFAKIS